MRDHGDAGVGDPLRVRELARERGERGRRDDNGRDAGRLQ